MADPAVTVHFTHRTGAVDRILSLLRRRGFPIAGMTLERTHRQGIGRMTVLLQSASAVEQVRRHLGKLPDVLTVSTAASADSVQREYALARVRCTPAQRAEVMALLTAFGARAMSVTGEGLVLEATGQPGELDALFAELERYGIEEAARTGIVALRRSSADRDESQRTEELA